MKDANDSEDDENGQTDRRLAAPASNSAEPQKFFRGMVEHLAELSRLADEHVCRLNSTLPEDSGQRSDIRYIHGLTDISEAINEALSGATREILTAQPDGSRPSGVLKDALESVRRHISAGVAMRTLYQHSTRFDEATKEYVREVTRLGASVRTLDEFFDRLVIVDDVAFIAANEDRTSAAAVREPAVVRFLRDTFDRSWDRAQPFPFVPHHAAKAADEVIPAIRTSIKRLLIEGYPDKQIARRLGISERSLQTHIASMKQELGARNRLQMGYLLGRNGTTFVL
ncbi:helix-turn-helix transcriptional regulator [Streptomyces chartreusis]|uniref:Helix-turn-helix transcriptional regulator n=1 Tax=Streptomyces chartreusis TaxID=1969 RepID=A0A7H8T4Y8_STRCX|nr:LuxR C-terminal-related transcriptional regulator [Streptomyces chartreusis]QKZ18132.1 helix-turn-helix transcriptional regulator [Streptomyces chartreusis]